MAQAMYGDWAQQLVVDLSVFQAIVWITLLLFALEVRKAALGTEICGQPDRVHDFTARSQSQPQEEGPSHQINEA
jgi:auxin efflux carrier family